MNTNCMYKKLRRSISFMFIVFMLLAWNNKAVAYTSGNSSAQNSFQVSDKTIREYTVIWNFLSSILPSISNITLEESIVHQVQQYKQTQKHLLYIQQKINHTKWFHHNYRQNFSFFKLHFKNSHYYYVYYLKKIII